MCNTNCINFGRQNLTDFEIRDKRVIEVGSYDINGSLRSVIEPMGPAEYIGVDIVKGCGVDVVCDAKDIRDRFGDESFDVVISTELIEHVLDWRRAISNFKNLCCLGGVILITTRSKGFEYHGWPYDFWRFEPSDMEKLFADFRIEKIETDVMVPGVFVKARKPSDFSEIDLTNFELFSIVDNKRVRIIEEKTLANFIRSHADEFRPIERQSLGGRTRKVLRDVRWRLKWLIR